MKFYICQPNAHHKNVESIRKMMEKNNINYTVCDDLSKIDESYTVAVCATRFFPPDQFPKGCKVIYGPQFFVFPDDPNHLIHKYTYDPSRFFYNSLSGWNLDIHKGFAPNLSLTFVTCPFGVDTETIKIVPSNRSRVMVYFKHRHPDTLNTVINFLKERNVDYYLFQYGSYQDSEFKDKLQDTKFVIWIGSHESQGFAFQETLASNVPILLWDVKSMYDEYNYGWVYDRYKSSGKSLLATTANVWSDACGIKFYEPSELPSAFEKMNSNLYTFSPRTLIEEKVSLIAAYENLIRAITKTIIIPIGIDCGTAGLLKDRGLRTCSFPFDWCVTYNGVSKLFKNDFKNFTSINENKLNTEYDVCFFHDFTSDARVNDEEKYTRRVTRVKTLLKTTKDHLLFFRKGHASHNHDEHNGRYSIIKSDIEDCEELYTILKTTYPALNFSIIVTLACGKCFDAKCNYTSNTIEIINIATPVVDNDRFEQTFSEILSRQYRIGL